MHPVPGDCKQSMMTARWARKFCRDAYGATVIVEARKTTREIVRALRALRRHEEAGILGQPCRTCNGRPARDSGALCPTCDG